jgi:hypothetical protein
MMALAALGRPLSIVPRRNPVADIDEVSLLSLTKGAARPEAL